MAKSPKEELFRGMRISGMILLTFFTLFLLVAGAGLAFTSARRLEFSNVALAKAAGWGALSLGAAIMIFTVQRWAKVLPGLLFLATLNGVVVTYSGYLVNNPSAQVPRTAAILSTLLFAASCVVSMHFYARRLGIVDRIALISFAACFVWGAVSNLAVLPLVLGLFALLLAWAKNASQERSQKISL
jgi:hypothetical protein